MVATGLTVLVAPLYIISDLAEDHRKYSNMHYAGCMRLAEREPTIDLVIRKSNDCLAEHRKSFERTPANWQNWRDFTLGTLAFCLAIYLIILTFVSIAKWVWRGRLPKNTETA